MVKKENSSQTFLARKLASVGVTQADFKSAFTEDNKTNIGSFGESDPTFAKLLFPEKKFTKKEIALLDEAVDCAMCIKSSNSYKKAYASLEAKCPGIAEVGQKLFHAYNIITYSGRRDLNKNEQKVMDQLMSTEISAKMVKELQIEDLWEDVRGERKNAASRLRKILEDPLWKRFFITKFVSDFSITTAISEALNKKIP